MGAWMDGWIKYKLIYARVLLDHAFQAEGPIDHVPMIKENDAGLASRHSCLESITARVTHAWQAPND